MPGPGRRFQPGVSGNPGGRPRNHVMAMARRHTEAAVEALVLALDNPSTRVAAACALLDRGWGKATQPVEADVDVRQSWVVRAPPAVTDTDEWFRRYAPQALLERDGD